MVMVGAIALSGGLVLAAQAVTQPPASSAALSAGPMEPAQDSANWQAALEQVQETEGITAPQAPSVQTVSELTAAAQSQNLTDTVGRTLLVNLSSATAQGLGSDDPTQNQLIAQAASQISASTTPTYSSDDLSAVPQTTDSLKQWGNDVIRTLNAYPAANAQATYTAVGTASDNQDASALKTLPNIADAYRQLAAALASVPVPQTVEPLELELVNDFAQMAQTYPDIEAMFSDPLRSLAGLQEYASLLDEATRVLTSMASALNKDGILFTKDEPGSAWSAFLPSQP